MESSQAPRTPVSVFVPPGVVDARKRLGRHGRSLLMLDKDIGESLSVPEGHVQVHRATTRYGEVVRDTL